MNNVVKINKIDPARPKKRSVKRMSDFLGDTLNEYITRVEDLESRVEELEDREREVLTQKAEVARVIGCSRTTVYRYIEDGIIQVPISKKEIRRLKKMGAL